MWSVTITQTNVTWTPEKEKELLDLLACLHIYYEVNPWSKAPMAGYRGELIDYEEGSGYPVVLQFTDPMDGKATVRYAEEEVTLLYDKVYPY